MHGASSSNCDNDLFKRRGIDLIGPLKEDNHGYRKIAVATEGLKLILSKKKSADLPVDLYSIYNPFQKVLGHHAQHPERFCFLGAQSGVAGGSVRLPRMLTHVILY